MKVAAILALGLVLVVMSIEISRFWREGGLLQSDRSAIENKLVGVRGEAASLEENLKYFSYQENLEKEMRARFNYRSADEKLIILVPKDSASSTLPAR